MIIGIFTGILIGVLIAIFAIKIRTIGNLVIIDDPDGGSYMFLEINKADVDILRKQRVVKLNIVDKCKMPHK